MGVNDPSVARREKKKFGVKRLIVHRGRMERSPKVMASRLAKRKQF